MNILFVHDHKFRIINNRVYSPGGFPNEVLTRYSDLFGNVTFVGRIIKESTVLGTYSEITNKHIKIFDSSHLFSCVEKSDGLIVRLPSVNGFKALHLAQKLGKKTLVEVVGCVKDAYWNYSILGKIVAYPAFYLMKYYVRRSKYTVYVTNQFLQHRYPCTGKSAVISNVSLNSVISCINQKQIRPNVLRLGTLAAIDVAYKGQKYMIRAIPLIEHALGVKIEYQLVGPGKPDRLLKTAREMNVSDRVVIKGAMPHSEVFSWLDSLDVYIQPSLTEGLPRALIEAMSRGKVCFASDCGGNPELIEPECLFNIHKKSEIPRMIKNRFVYIFENNLCESQQKRNLKVACDLFDRNKLDEKRKLFYSSFKEYLMEGNERCLQGISK